MTSVILGVESTWNGNVLYQNECNLHSKDNGDQSRTTEILAWHRYGYYVFSGCRSLVAALYQIILLLENIYMFIFSYIIPNGAEFGMIPDYDLEMGFYVYIFKRSLQNLGNSHCLWFTDVLSCIILSSATSARLHSRIDLNETLQPWLCEHNRPQ